MNKVIKIIFDFCSLLSADAILAQTTTSLASLDETLGNENQGKNQEK